MPAASCPDHAWMPLYDWGRWNKRWGADFPPPPGGVRARGRKKAQRTISTGRKQWEENQEECEQLSLKGS